MTAVLVTALIATPQFSQAPPEKPARVFEPLVSGDPASWDVPEIR